MRASEMRTPNFGTFPSAFVKVAPPSDSWWVGLNREAFAERAKVEQVRMIGSAGAKLVDQLNITHLSAYVPMRALSSVKALGSW